MSKRYTPIVFREAGVDPTLDEIPLKRATLRPLMGCGVFVLVGCIASFLLVAGMSYANGRHAAELAAQMVPSEYSIPPGSPTNTATATLEDSALTETAVFFITASPTTTPTITPSQTITDTPTCMPTDEPTAIPPTPRVVYRNVPQVVERSVPVYVIQTAQPLPPVEVEVTRRVVVKPDTITIVVTATPTATETSPESTPEVTESVTATATETPTLTPTATETATEFWIADFTPWPYPTPEFTPDIPLQAESTSEVK
jgi:hypothetical protein